jgi:hypothetical protein
VGPTAGLDDVEKRKFLPPPGLELRPPVVQPVASRYTDYAIPASIRDCTFSNCLHATLIVDFTSRLHPIRVHR